MSSGSEDKAAPSVAVGIEADTVKGDENVIVDIVDNGTDVIGSSKKAREFPDVPDKKINMGSSQMTSHSFGHTCILCNSNHL